MKIDSIILDLDDTLNSCTMHLLHTLGCPVGPFDYRKYPIEVGYDMIGAWAKLSGRDAVTAPVFWEWISRRTWKMMPPSGQFWLIDAAASMVGKENVLIATVPTKSPDCLFGKYEWMDEHLPDWMKRQYNITPRKHRLSMPGVLLIDDHDANIKAWKERGGDAILVPRPWNSMHEIGVDNVAVSSYLAEELSKREATNVA
jgi:hypothetical protein